MELIDKQKLLERLEHKQLTAINEDISWAFGIIAKEISGIFDDHSIQEEIAKLNADLEMCRNVSEARGRMCERRAVERDEWKARAIQAEQERDDARRETLAMCDENIKIGKTALDVQQERNALLEGLKWYADDNTYKLGVNITMGSAFPLHEPIKSDKGERARYIIAKIESDQVHPSTIPWKNYDREHPPEYGKSFLVTDGHAVDIAYLMQPIEYDDDNLENEPVRWYPPDLSSLDDEGITHYAEITLPIIAKIEEK